MSRTSADDRSNQAVLPVSTCTLPPLGLGNVPPHDLRRQHRLSAGSWRKPSGRLFRARSTRDFRRVTGCFVRVKKPSQPVRRNALYWDNSRFEILGGGDQHVTTRSTEGVFEGVALVIEQPQIAHRTPEMPLVHDADEGRIAGRGHPPDAL